MPKKSQDHEDDDALPVTQEVGGEGGSYADATVQSETLKGDLPRVGDVLQPAPPGRVAAEAPPSPQDAEDGLRFPETKP